MIKDGGKLIDFSSKNRDYRVRCLERLLLVFVDLYVRGFGIVLKKVHVRKKEALAGKHRYQCSEPISSSTDSKSFRGKGGERIQ